MSVNWNYVLIGILLLGSFCPAAVAQENVQSAVVIEVKDQSGAAVQNAEIEIRPHQSSSQRKLTTDDNGRLAVNLGTGTYDLVVTYPGFRPATRRVGVEDGKSQTLTLVLQVGSCPPGPCLTVTAPPGLEPLGLESSGAKLHEDYTQRVKHPQGAQPSFSIVINAPKDVLKTGSPISVEVNPTNLSNHEINNSRVRRFSGPYEIDVMDEQGNPRPETEASHLANKSTSSNRMATYSIIFSSLKPGEVEHDRIDVERYIDLSQPGKYTVQLHQFDGESKTIVKSNTITITLAPPTGR